MLFTNQKALQLENLPKYAETAGVSGTPSFLLVLAATDRSGNVQATKFIRGAQPYNVFEDAIKKLLAPDQG